MQEVKSLHDLFVKVTPVSHICAGLVQGAVCNADVSRDCGCAFKNTAPVFIYT